MSNGGNNSSANISKIDSSILVPSGVYETSGLINGSYLSASPSATVTLVEFGDYVCPACGDVAPYVKQVLSDFPGKVNYVFRNYPLSYHTNAPLASYAAEAAGLQGKYFEMHDLLYSTQDAWSNLPDPTSVFIGYAKDLGLNTDKFTSDMNSRNVKDLVQRDMNDGKTVALTETPTFYINGTKVKLSGDPNQLRDLIQAELAK